MSDHLDPAPPARDTALLVIHGIGEQNPYETLDQAARGFARCFRGRGHEPVLRAERIRHEDWTEVAVHLEFAEPATERGLRRLSLFEFYWAPYTEDKVTYRAVIGWLMRTAFTPLRYLADNLLALLNAHERRSRGLVVRLFLREIARTAFGYLPFLGLALLAVILLIRGLAPLRPFSGPFRAALEREPNLIALAAAALCLALAAVLALFIVRELWQWWRRHTPSIERVAEQTWVLLAVALLVAFGAAGVWIARIGHVDLASYGGLLLRRSNVALVLGALGTLWLRRVLVDYLGDVAVYVSADEKTASYRARTAILEASSRALTRLLRREAGGYDRVVVMGHSLGSVIAYDTINELLSAVWASPDGTTPQRATLGPDDLARLKGLITFGSPLDKVYYFFREHVGSDQAVRAQILSFLYSFLRGYSGRDYGAFTFTYPGQKDLEARDRPFAFPRLDDFRWLNVWSPADPVSGPLHFYRLADQDRLRRWYWQWGLAHLEYWRDPKVYEFVAARLL